MSHITVSTPRSDDDKTFMLLLMAIPLLLGAMGILSIAALVVFCSTIL
jgi:hypothetical protein